MPYKIAWCKILLKRSGLTYQQDFVYYD